MASITCTFDLLEAWQLVISSTGAHPQAPVGAHKQAAVYCAYMHGAHAGTKYLHVNYDDITVMFLYM